MTSIQETVVVAVQIVLVACLGIAGGAALQPQTAQASSSCGYKCDEGTFNDECVDASPELACDDPWGWEGCSGENTCNPEEEH